MYEGEDIIHATASENLSIATGWMILSIALGSTLTFTFFAAISTSFYCCQKPIKKENKDSSQGILNEGNSEQKLFFPNVPSSVYPTTQSILQQEDNEVVNSLSPAYRELPSTHFSYLSSFNGSTTIDATCFGTKQSTTLPNSTKCSIHPHTTSLSSEQVNIQSPSNDNATCEQDTSLNNPNVINDTSLSIHITSPAQDTQLCLTSSTSGILTEGDLTTGAQKDSGEIIEPAMSDQQFNEPVVNDQQLNGCMSREPSKNDQRLYIMADDSSRGASSFGGVDSNARNRKFSPDYYALTFRREGSVLSDDNGFSLRGASAFAPSHQRVSPTMVSATCEVERSECERGASVLGGRSIVVERQPVHFHAMTEREEPQEVETLKHTHELSNDKLAQPNLGCSTRELITSSLHPYESNTSKLQHENEILDMKKANLEQQNLQDSIKFPSCKNLSVFSRPDSKTNMNSHKASFEKHPGIGSSLLYLHKDNRNKYSENFTPKKMKIYNSSDTMSNKEPISINQQPIRTNQDYTEPITILQNPAPCVISEAIKNHDTKSVAKTAEYKLNTTYQSLRGASQLGDDDVRSDCDALWDSVSLSFAYESPSDEDVISQIGCNGN